MIEIATHYEKVNGVKSVWWSHNWWKNYCFSIEYTEDLRSGLSEWGAYYNATGFDCSDTIVFEDEKMATMFLLRWSC